MKIEIPQKEIEAFCRRHHTQKLPFFGSVLRDDFGPESDVDVADFDILWQIINQDLTSLILESEKIILPSG